MFELPPKASLVAEDPKGMCHVSDLTVIDLSSPKIRAGAAECPQQPAGSGLPRAERGGGAVMTSAARDDADSARYFAAHELRGEITLQLPLAEATLTGANADSAALREMGNGVVAACERQDRLLKALLTLARAEHGHLRREPVDLAATAAEVLRAHDHRELRSTSDPDTRRPAASRAPRREPDRERRPLQPARRPAQHHHLRRRRPCHLDDREHRTRDPDRRAHRLFQPFQRRNSHEGASADGVGLVLAIVQAIANAHDAMVNAEPRTGGGLRIAVGFPAVA